ncbi:MAG: Tetrahydromethanopterin S-methyltransferase subunit G [Methanocella sp. PtaU1.Bin125]|nr:MAG: Tetrahydromethanopterin S-methyltransferase subunit G [Methanocella sp. PtaU1.Bin125]
MVTHIKLLPEFKLSYGVETGKVEPEAGGPAKAAGPVGPVGPVIDPKDYTAAIKRINDIEEKVEFVASEIQQSEGKHLGREIGILYGILFGVLIYVAYSIFIQLGLI